MSETTPRLGLPLLASGQAQKEITHNEALVLLDGLVQPIVQAVAPAAIPAAPVPGQCWIVGAGATGVWSGHDLGFALWTEGGWRFVESRTGMLAWSLGDGLPARREENGWVLGLVEARAVMIGGLQVVGGQQAAIAEAVGGSNSDSEARIAIAAILQALRNHGLIAR